MRVTVTACKVTPEIRASKSLSSIMKFTVLKINSCEKMILISWSFFSILSTCKGGEFCTGYVFQSCLLLMRAYTPGFFYKLDSIFFCFAIWRNLLRVERQTNLEFLEVCKLGESLQGSDITGWNVILWGEVYNFIALYIYIYLSLERDIHVKRSLCWLTPQQCQLAIWIELCYPKH